jgi:hypothetical protein
LTNAKSIESSKCDTTATVSGKRLHFRNRLVHRLRRGTENLARHFCGKVKRLESELVQFEQRAADDKQHQRRDGEPARERRQTDEDDEEKVQDDRGSELRALVVQDARAKVQPPRRDVHRDAGAGIGSVARVAAVAARARRNLRRHVDGMDVLHVLHVSTHSCVVTLHVSTHVRLNARQPRSGAQLHGDASGHSAAPRGNVAATSARGGIFVFYVRVSG